MSNISASKLVRNGKIQNIAIFLAAIYVLLALSQLFGYDEFEPVIAVLLGSETAAVPTILSTIIVTLEVFAVAYFLPLYMSRLARICALGCAIAAPVVWLITMANSLLQGLSVNSGALGSHISLKAGIIPIVLMVAILVMTFVVAYFDRRAHLEIQSVK